MPPFPTSRVACRDLYWFVAAAQAEAAKAKEVLEAAGATVEVK